MTEAIEHELAVLWRFRVIGHDHSHWRQWVRLAPVAGLVQVVPEIVMAAFAVIRRDEGFPSEAVVDREATSQLPTILNVSAKVRLTRIQPASGTGRKTR